VTEVIGAIAKLPYDVVLDAEPIVSGRYSIGCIKLSAPISGDRFSRYSILGGAISRRSDKTPNWLRNDAHLFGLRTEWRRLLNLDREVSDVEVIPARIVDVERAALILFA
jgi:hypothetical protein